MENHKLVLPEHLNQYGFLFGGYLLNWVDECSWIAARLDYPSSGFVTVAMDKVEFRKSVQKGTILKFHVDKTRSGVTSVTYSVRVTRDNIESGRQDLIFSTSVTLVCIDESGNKIPLPKR
jgi:acyl-CoA hydrolase